ncbi:MAG: LacI family DNA-binding transcriptional regulator [Planctomycetes bacterium]|nr:LacI family DNA-binding transcriptional regulator [Planctomycetota bacterium]
MTKQSQITQKDLARLAGLSQQTVNRALACHPDVCEKTQREVQRLAQEHGYRPNAAAQAMRSGRHGCVLLLMSTDRGKSFLPNGLLDGIHDELAAHDQRLMIANLDDETFGSASILPAVLRRWTADGIIINYTHSIPPRLEELLGTLQLPVVWINVKRDANAVYPDDRSSGAQATRRLLELGHRRIAFVNTMSEKHYSTIDRRGGYEDAMREAGLPADCLLVPDRFPEASERREILRAFLRREPRPSAIVTARPHDALTVRLLALEMGLRLPADLSLMTISEAVEDRDGTALSAMLVPEREVGRTAVSLLLRGGDPSAALPAVSVPPIPFDGESVCPFRGAV